MDLMNRWQSGKVIGLEPDFTQPYLDMDLKEPYEVLYAMEEMKKYLKRYGKKPKGIFEDWDMKIYCTVNIKNDINCAKFFQLVSKFSIGSFPWIPIHYN